MLDPELRATNSGKQSVSSAKRPNGGQKSGAVAAARSSGSSPKKFVVTYRVMDQVAVAADGWIAIARFSPFRIDWCDPNPRCAAGKRLNNASRLLTDRDKEAFLRVTSATAQWPPTDKPSETVGWSDSLPPFVQPPSARGHGSALMITPEGHAIIRRVPSAELPASHYDIINRRGEFVYRLSLPLNSSVVGFGRNSVFVTTTDRDGLQELTRHPWKF